MTSMARQSKVHLTGTIITGGTHIFFGDQKWQAKFLRWPNVCSFCCSPRSVNPCTLIPNAVAPDGHFSHNYAHAYCRVCVCTEHKLRCSQTHSASLISPPIIPWWLKMHSKVVLFVHRWKRHVPTAGYSSFPLRLNMLRMGELNNTVKTKMVMAFSQHLAQMQGDNSVTGWWIGMATKSINKLICSSLSQLGELSL